jgi:hypothetical protein
MEALMISFTKTFAVLSTMAAMAMLAGCSSGADEESGESENAVSQGAVQVNVSTAFEGTFNTRDGNRTTKRRFAVTAIDWANLKATWTDWEDVAGAKDDAVGQAAKISLARCPGCFALTVGPASAPIVRGTHSNGTLVLSYLGKDATAVTITGATSEEAPAAPTANANAAGACSLSCGTQFVDCVDGVTEAECNASSFTSLPRCITRKFTFEASATCTR